MIRIVIFLLIIFVGAIGIYRSTKTPYGIGVASPILSVSPDSVTFLADSTYTTPTGDRVRDQVIFDEVSRLIREADSYILVDMFLYNDFLGAATSSYRQLSRELTDALIQKRQDSPHTQIVVITDPLNTVYGGYEPEHLTRLREAGITLILTNLTQLRDSNPLYSMWWRSLLRHVPDIGGAWLPNLLDANKPDVPLSAYLELFNFKANHRKLIVADAITANDTREWRTLITSANPHDGSSEHSNVAMLVTSGPFAAATIETEESVARMANAESIAPRISPLSSIPETNKSSIAVQLLTERAIKDSILETLDATQAGDHIDLLMFYLSDRDVISSLKQAAERGVSTRIMLDPNKDAFGREKNGIPNRQVAHELMKLSSDSLSIRWCATNGEQCHGKLLLVTRGNTTTAILGSANFTRRNLDNFNLETNVRLEATHDTEPLRQARELFDQLWNNADGNTFSLPYETYADSSLWKTIYYRIGEFTGLSTY